MFDSTPPVSNDSLMNQYWRYGGGALAAAILIGLLLPSRAIVERDVVINAYPASVFSVLNDFTQVNRWSGRFDVDPNVRISLSGPPRGVGAELSWEGQIIGRGRMTITESVPFEQLSTALLVDEETEATVTISFSRDEGVTRLNWRFERNFGLDLPARLYGLLLEGIVGEQIDQDLERLRQFAESLPKSDFSDLDVEQMYVEATTIAYRTTTSIPAASAISAAMADAYFEVRTFIDRFDLEEAGAPLSITRMFSGSEMVFDVGIPVRGSSHELPVAGQPVRIGLTYAGPAVRVRHIGPYRTLGRTHDKIAAWLAALGIERNGDAWEVYISDPTRTIESELLTYVYYPVRNGANDSQAAGRTR